MEQTAKRNDWQLWCDVGDGRTLVIPGMTEEQARKVLAKVSMELYGEFWIEFPGMYEA